MRQDNDRLAYLEEDDPDAALPPGQGWPLLIVDDDEDVHLATEFALRGLSIVGRQLEFLHARSAGEAIEVLRGRPDVAVILLDVVMEREDAGLEAVGRIRDELGLSAVRIVLRTGRPGYAPELDAVSNYDINDYKSKAELTRSKLFTTVTSAVRSYEQIRRLEESRAGLALIVEGVSRFDAEAGMAAFGASVIEQAAALLGAPRDGFVCIGKGEAAPVVIAGAGSYAAYGERALSAVDPVEAREMVERCLADGARQLEDKRFAFRFTGRHGDAFAAFVESRDALRAVEDHLLDVFCANLAICGENVHLVERLRTTAYVDGLTGLPNRAAQIEAIDRIAREEGRGRRILALVDIDRFSETIDVLGYRYGDRLLQEVARRLRGAFSADVFVARVGGDLFGVFGDPQQVNAGQLRRILAAPFEGEGGQRALSFSMGFAGATDSAIGGADLVRNASLALKRAKDIGPGSVLDYTQKLADATRRHVSMLHDLRTAFMAGRLAVVYQPQIDLASGRTIGVEALLRWYLDDGAVVPLEQIIPVAEQSGLIIHVGAWVLRTALGVQRRLSAGGRRLRMAVNVSAVQFRHPDFVAMVGRALGEAAIEPGLLEVEITESAALHGWTQTIERLEALRALGVCVAIDDFGTGFSSLAYLDRLPADCLKIDRSFIRALDDPQAPAPIAETVIALGRQLGMRVLAEGIETVTQRDRLTRLGCHEGQGWLYAQPMPEGELATWLNAQEA